MRGETTRDASPTRGLPALIGFLLACLVVSALGGAVTASSVGSWYPTLAKPPFNPPDWVFAPVWTLLYVLIAVAGWRAWCAGRGMQRRRALALYWLQLALNLGWSCLFFGLRSPGAGLAGIALLLLAIVATMLAFRRLDRIATMLFVPYLGWVAFAAVLNAAIWRLN